MEHEIPFGNFNRENGPTFLDFPLFPGIFQRDEPTKRFPFSTEPKFPKILTKWKALCIYYVSRNRGPYNKIDVYDCETRSTHLIG